MLPNHGKTLQDLKCILSKRRQLERTTDCMTLCDTGKRLNEYETKRSVSPVVVGERDQEEEHRFRKQ